MENNFTEEEKAEMKKNAEEGLKGLKKLSEMLKENEAIKNRKIVEDISKILDDKENNK